MASKETFKKAWEHLSAGFPTFRPTPETVKAYRQDTDDIRDPFLWRAAQELRRECEWFPAIAKLRSRALRYQEEADERDAERQRSEERQRHEAEVAAQATPEAKAQVKALLEDLYRKMGQPDGRPPR